MSEILNQIQDNFTFLLACIAIGLAMVGLAKLAEHFLPSRRSLSPSRRVSIVGMCSAIAMILYVLDFPPFPFLHHPFTSWIFPTFPFCCVVSSLAPARASAALGSRFC